MTETVRSRWVDSAVSVPADRFDGRFFCTTVAWTQAWEGVRTEQVRDFRHLALEGGPMPELVPFYLVDHSPIWRGYEEVAGVPPVWSGPVVYSSTVYGVHGGAGGSSAAYRTRVVDLGLEQAERWGAEALVLSNLDGDDAEAWSADRPSGRAVLLDRKYEAPVGGSDSAFLGRMTSKVRRELRRQWRRAVDRGVRLQVLTGSEIPPRLDEFTRLAIDSSEKHTDNIYGSDMFRNLVSVPGAVLLAAEHQGQMVGAFYCFLHRGRFSLVIAGLDDEKMRELNTYAYLMYEALRYSVANDAEIINVGRCNYAYKERHAFEGTDVWALVYLTGSRPDLADALERMNKGVHEYLAQNSGAAVTVTTGRRLGYSGTLAVLLTTIVGTNIGYMALLPYLPRLSENLGLSPAGLAIFLTGFAVAKILGQLLGGYLADAWGLRATAAVGLVAAALGMTFIVFADSANPANLGRLIWGGADGVITPVLYRALAVISAEHGRDPAEGNARLGSVAALSFAAGPFVVGLVHPFADYPTVLAVAAGLTLVNALVAWLVLPDRARSAPADVEPESGLDRFGPLLRAVAFFGIVDLFANLLWAAMEPLVPLYLGQAYEDPIGRAAWVLTLGMVVFAIVNPLLARLSGRWRMPRMAGVGLAVLGVSSIALGNVADLAWGLIAISVFMMAQAYIFLIARNGIQQYGGGTGKAWGIFGMFSDGGLLLGPLVAVWLFESYGSSAFMILGIGSLLAAALSAAFSTSSRRLRL